MGTRVRRIARAAVFGVVMTASFGLAGAPLDHGREGGPQQQPPPPPTPQPPIFRTGINFVRVDVIVSDKQGNAVADLEPGDFDVTEDNKPQKIDTFKLIKLDGGGMAAADGPPKPIRSD